MSGSYLYPSAGSVLVASGTNGNMWSAVTDTTTPVEKRLDKIEKRLCILAEPDHIMLEKYKTLKKAYEEYLVLEKLILGGDST